MANKRVLKKEINAIADALTFEYVLTSSFIPGVDRDKATEILYKVLELRKEYLARVGANGGKEPKMVKAYYKKLISDFNEQVDNIISEFAALTNE